MAGRVARQTAIRLCLLVVMASTGALTILAVISVRRQQESIDSLSRSNLLLAGNRLAGEIETAIITQASADLRDAARSLEIDQSANVRKLQQQAARHPPLDRFVIASRTAVLVPRLREGVTTSTDLPGSSAMLWSRAESAAPAESLAYYFRLHEQTHRGSERARAMTRIAGTLARLNRKNEANAAFARLGRSFSDDTDLYGRPYALISAFATNNLQLVKKDFESGRWNLSVELYEHYGGRFAEAGLPVQEPRGSPYLSARAVASRFQPAVDLKRGDVRFFADESSQYAYTPLEPAAFLVARLDPVWVQSSVIPEVIRKADFPGSGELVPAGSTGPATLRLPSLFPFWSLRLAEPASHGVAGVRATAAFGGAAALAILSLSGALIVMMRGFRAEAAFLQLRSDLVAGVTHDLKTPLTAIRLYADTLDTGTLDDSTRREFSSVIALRSQWLTHLIDNVLDFSRIDSGRKEYNFTSADFVATVRSTLELFRPIAQGFRVLVSIPDGLPGIPHDPVAIGRCLLNLLDNAVKYSGDSRWIGVTLRQTDEVIRLEVEDRGLGIPPHEHSRIFESHFRGSRGKSQGGYGMGLFVAQHAARGHGGTIEVHSAVDEGARFSLVIPCPRSS